MSDLDDLVARVEQHQRETWPQMPVGRYSAERALLRRDVAEVEREAASLSERSALLTAYAKLYLSQAKTCRLLCRIYPKNKNYKRALGMRIGELTGAERGRRWVDRRSADCQAWLARAKAVLG